MRKLIIIAVLVFGMNAPAQKVGLGVNYSFENALGAELTVETKSNIVFGFGGTFTLESYGVGKHDVKNTYSNFYREDYNSTIKNKKDYSVYVSGGYKYKKLIFMTRVGYGQMADYTNYYDRFRILGSNGYYYTKKATGEELLLGGSLDVETFKNLYVSLGYDTFNKLTTGLTYKF